jgi:alpha-glucosidase
MIVDIVPNHISSEHPWFKAALAAPDAPERDYFWFRPGKGAGGAEMPTRWRGEFGGTTWTRTTNPDGTPGDWYLHLFTPEQPDLNWDHPDVRAEFEDILRFWFDRGVDGIRIDSAALLLKDPALPEVLEDNPHPYHDLDGVHDIYRAWRRLADSYDGDRALIGEVWMPEVERFANYLRPDELHTAFNFDFLGCAWDPGLMRACIDRTLHAHAPSARPPPGCCPTTTSPGTSPGTAARTPRSASPPTRRHPGRPRAGHPPRPGRGPAVPVRYPAAPTSTRARSSGLWENEQIPPDQLQDPMWARHGHSRDGCRVPLPWSGDDSPFGFSHRRHAASWLPSRRSGRTAPYRPRPGTRVPCWSCTARRYVSARRSRACTSRR